MSVILVTDSYRTIRLGLERLRNQTAKGQLELVIVMAIDVC